MSSLRYSHQFVHYKDFIDNPIAANEIAQVCFGIPDDPTDEELIIVAHLIEQLKLADEERFKRKQCPLAQEYDELISKEIH